MLPKLRRFARRVPFLRGPLRQTYRAGQYLLARMLGKIRQEPYHLLDVNPLQIRQTVNLDDETLKGNQVWHFGTVSDGNWDVGGESIQTYNHVFAIMRQFCIEERPLDEIEEFQVHVEAINAGAFLDGCSTPEQYVARWKETRSLLEKIRRSGYRTQKELGSENHLDEVRVQIGRKGEFLLEEGLHRLVIAQVLQLPTIPVLVTRRHLQWETLRQAVLKIVLQRGFIHQPFNHPDLDMLPQFYGNHLKDTAMYGNERWEYIRASLPLTSGTVLDIGSYFGYFPHHFEASGFSCVALEPDRENLAVLEAYRAIQGKQFEVCTQSLFDFERHDFDIVLALNIFHHLVKTKQDHDALVEFLRSLNCQYMYFEPASNDSHAYKNFSDDAFIQFVLNNSCLQHAAFLGKTREQRSFYLLSTLPLDK